MDVPPLLAQLLYWIFLILWSFTVAYMLVVQQAHARLASRMNVFLFGESAGVDAHEEHKQQEQSSGHGGEARAESHGVAPPHAPKDSHIDEHPPRLFAKVHGGHGHAPTAPSLPRAEHATDATDEFIVAQLARTK